MAIITSIGVVTLASLAAILINDHTRFGGRLDDGDDNFSIFSKPAEAAAMPVRMDETSRYETNSPQKELVLH